MFGGDTIHKIQIMIESVFDSKGFIEAKTQIDSLASLASSLNMPFNKAAYAFNKLTKSKDGWSGQGGMEKFIQEYSKGKSLFEDKFGIPFETARKGALEFDALTNTMKMLKIKNIQVGESAWMIGDAYSNAGITGKEAFERLGRATMRFKMYLMSIMFFGMQLQRTFGGFLKTSIDGYMKLTNAQTPVGKSILRMQASMEYFKFAMVEALAPLIMYFTQLLAGVMDFVAAHPKLMEVIGLITGLLAAAGTFMFVGGQVSMFLSALKMAGISTELVTALGVGGWLVALGAAGIAVAVGVRWAYDNNLFGIKDAIDQFANWVKPVSEEVRKNLDLIRTAVLDLGKWFIDTFQNAMPPALQAFWDGTKNLFESIRSAIQGVLDVIDRFRTSVLNLPSVKLPTVTSVSASLPSTWNTPAVSNPFHDFIWRPGEGAIGIDSMDTLIGTKNGIPSGSGGNVSYSPTYYISGSNTDEFKKILADHDRQLMSNISRMKIPGV
jgi:hypothetical protein